MQYKKRKTSSYSWRWPWISLVSAVIIWLTSDIYFKRLIQIERIEFSTSAQDTEDLIKKHQRSIIRTKAFSSVIAISAVIFLFKKAGKPYE